jgi:hypothetical protein
MYFLFSLHENDLRRQSLEYPVFFDVLSVLLSLLVIKNT